MMTLEICDLFGIDLPVIQAPMAGVQGSRLALAVSAAGGLGSLPAAMLTHDKLRQELTLLAATGKPYNVNFFCHKAPAVEEPQLEKWFRTLRPYYDELKIDVNARPHVGARRPFDDETLQLLQEFEPPVVSFHFGLPAPGHVEAIKAWGARVISTATTVRESVWLEQHGVDAVIAQGLEAGGHRGMFLEDDINSQSGTFALLPQVCHAVSIPVIAAGGIVNTESTRAAFALGAGAVQAGTVFLLTDECDTTALHRQKLKSTPMGNTVLTNVFSGRPARGIINRVVSEVGPMSQFAPPFPLAGAALAPLRAVAEKSGNSDFSPLWSGQNASACRERPAMEVTRELARLR